MNRQRNFSIQQIVWAKLPQYPWWPGKIINIVSQNKRKVYKISFFADPTYCFLHEENLSPFDNDTIYNNSLQQKNSILKKAIQLAKTKFKKKLYEKMNSKRQYPQVQNNQSRSHSNISSEKLQPKQQFEVQLKLPQNEHQIQKMQSEAKIELLQNTHITIQNVVQLLQNGLVCKLQKQRGYINRKTTFEIIAKLEHFLLKKYNLSNLHKHHALIKDKKNKLFVKRSLLHRQKYCSKQINENIKKLSLITLYRQLKYKKVNSSLCKNFAINLINKIEEISNGCYETYKKIFLKTIEQIKQLNEQFMGNTDYLELNQYIFDKKQDQQKSKVTQAFTQ